MTEVKMLFSTYKKEIKGAPLRPRKVIIAQKIKEFRYKNHLTQGQFAGLFGATAQCVSKWEREECYPDITLLPALAEALNCRIEDFFA